MMMGFSTSFANTMTVVWSRVHIVMMLMMMTKVDIQVISVLHQMRVSIVEGSNMMMGFSTSLANTMTVVWNWINVVMVMMMMTKVDI
jgi:hypothetical protein